MISSGCGSAVRGWRIEATPGVACFIAEFVVCGAVMSQDKIC